MKTEAEVEAMRKRLVRAAYNFGHAAGMPFAAHQMTAEQLHFMALGAVAHSSWALDRDTAFNFTNMLEALELDNAKRNN